MKPKEIIEGRKNPYREITYFKISGKDPVDISFISGKNFSLTNPFLVRKLLKKNKRTTYTDIHTHPSKEGFIALPSDTDLRYFLVNKNIGNLVVVQQEQDSGEVHGYFYFRKTKNTPLIHPWGIWSTLFGNQKAFKKMKSHLDDYFGILRFNPKKAVEDFTKEYNLNYRFIPAEGFEYNEKYGSFTKQGKLKEKSK
jgi:hypothetical protein